MIHGLEEQRAILMLARGASAEEVSAVCFGVNLNDPKIAEAVAWLRGTSDAMRLTPDYLKLLIMQALEETAEVEVIDPSDVEAAAAEEREPKMIKKTVRALGAKDRARLLVQLAKMR